MTKTHRKATDERLYADAEDAFRSEGGSVSQAVSATESAAQRERERVMVELSICYGGLRYEYDGYRNDRLVGAVGCAAPMRFRFRSPLLAHR